MWRCEATMSASVAVRGMTRYDGSPHHGFCRSPSASKGGSASIERPAVLTRATVASRSGRGNRVQGTRSRGAMAIMVFTIVPEAGLRYRNESTVRIGGLKVGLFSRIVNHEAEVFIPG